MQEQYLVRQSPAFSLERSFEDLIVYHQFRQEPEPPPRVSVWRFSDDYIPELNIGGITITDRRKVFVTLRQVYRTNATIELEGNRH